MFLKNKLSFLLCIICLLLSITLDAQSKKKKKKEKPVYTIDVSGGLFSHGKMTSNSESNFWGSKIFQVGYSKFSKSKKKGFSLGAQSHKSEFDNGIVFSESRSSFYLNYNFGYETLKREKNKLYLGGFTGFIYDRASSVPEDARSYPININQVGINFGPQIEFVQILSDKISFVLGARLGLLEVAFRTAESDNPTLPVQARKQSQLDFIFAERLNLNVGLSIKL